MEATDVYFLSNVEKDVLCRHIENGLQFVDVPDVLLCSNCSLVPINHYIFECGHTYCRTCYNVFQSEGRKCRKCMVRVSQEVKQDKDFESAVIELTVKCPNMNIGCEEVVSLKEFLAHEEKCKKRLLPKPYVEKEYDFAEDVKDQLRALTIKMELVERSSADARKENQDLKEELVRLRTDQETIIQEKLEAAMKGALSKYEELIASIAQSQEEMDDKITDMVDGNKTAITPASPTDEPDQPKNDVICNRCRQIIRGTRYICLKFDDRYLCEACEPKQYHCLLRIPSALQGVPTELINQLKSSHFKNYYWFVAYYSCPECHTTSQYYRYDCLMCDNYRHCETCERAQCHPDHLVIKTADIKESENIPKILEAKTIAKAYFVDKRLSMFRCQDNE